MRKTCNGLVAVLLGLAARSARGVEAPKDEYTPQFNGNNLN